MSQSSSFSNLGGTTPGQGPRVAIPDMPKLPEDVLARFPSLRQWQADMQKAWAQVKGLASQSGGG